MTCAPRGSGLLHSSGNVALLLDPDRCTSLKTARPHCMFVGTLAEELKLTYEVAYWGGGPPFVPGFEAL
jgi:hypothetical protein